jgi:hypothetical protein
LHQSCDSFSFPRRFLFRAARVLLLFLELLLQTCIEKRVWARAYSQVSLYDFAVCLADYERRSPENTLGVRLCCRLLDFGKEPIACNTLLELFRS